MVSYARSAELIAKIAFLSVSYRVTRRPSGSDRVVVKIRGFPPDRSLNEREVYPFLALNRGSENWGYPPTVALMRERYTLFWR